jgi:hypothetical protein
LASYKFLIAKSTLNSPTFLFAPPEYTPPDYVPLECALLECALLECALLKCALLECALRECAAALDPSNAIETRVWPPFDAFLGINNVAKDVSFGVCKRRFYNKAFDSE